jgi:DNA polymerase-3 subunit gamma/tau
MAKRAYYRKYRPRSISEVMGQPHITQTLENAIKSGNISHAYLFSGPRGVGKTSVARIFAHEVNEIPYEDDSTHLDIIEIDAASNRRIDEIRDLRDKIGIAPSSAQYKVYIIDEVHMLTKEAFNALLKTLEEPPEHAIFILATTEAHKLPDTILSRTQRHTFKPASRNDLRNHLAMIAKKEKVDVSEEALGMIAEHASGSYRDALSLLDQLATTGGNNIDSNDVRESLGLASSSIVSAVLNDIDSGDSKSLLESLESAFVAGVSAGQLAKQLVTQLQSDWVSGGNFEYNQLRMVDGLISVQASSEPEIKLSLVLLEACIHTDVSPQSPKSQPRKVRKVTSSPELSKHDNPKAVSEPSNDELANVEETREFNQDAWQRALETIKKSNNSLYAVLRMARAGLNGSDDVVILTFQFPFHHKQVSSSKNRQVVEKVLSAELGQPIRLKLVVDKDLEIKNVEDNQIVKDDDDNGADVSGIIDIMGGGEVVSI